MADEYTIQKRLGARVPRSILWPPYMVLNPYFTDFSDSIDTVWGNMLDNAVTALVNIRNVWVTNPEMEAKILDPQMMGIGDWSIPERETLVKQVNMLGMKLKSAGILSDENYLVVSRYLGMYWFGKGTEAFIDFINFCLIADLTVSKFWSQNTPNPNEYNNMTVEDADGNPPGTPIWEGGTWFPTTHVQITAQGGLNGLSIQTLGEFFYEIANYNLVLYAIESSFTMPIVDTLIEGKDTATIVAVAIVKDHTVVMSTQGEYGATPPPLTNVQPGKPGLALSLGVPDYNAAYTLMSPSSWFENPDGKKVVIYSTAQQTVQTTSSLPTTVVGTPTGDAADPASYTVLMGPVQFIKIPGSGNSTGRVPVWTAVPSTVVNTGMSTRTIGAREVGFLTNPDGWLEISSGLFTPYWN